MICLVDPPCIGLSVELAGRLSQELPDSGLSRQFSLPRARLEAGISRGPVLLRVAMVAVRSGGEQGYIGVDGEAILPAFQIGELRLQRGEFAGGIGIVDDPWTLQAESGWLPEIAPSFGEEKDWMSRSDLGIWAQWSPRIVSLRVDLTSGEGAFLRERNDQKNIAGTLVINPTPETALVIYGRQGFVGLGGVMDHRLGFQAAYQGFVGEHPFAAGLQLLQTWGVGGDSLRHPTGASAFLRLEPWGPLIGYGRFDMSVEEQASTTGVSWTGRLGAGARIGPALAMLGWEHTSTGADAAAVAGAEGFLARDLIFVQLGANLMWESR